jgi:hypothetical protein
LWLFPYLITLFYLLFSLFNEGASVHACRKAGRHFVAMEGDEEIFKAILEPFIVDTVTEGLKKQRIDGDDAEVEELPDPVFTH